MKPCSDTPSGPVSVGELLQQYPYGQRITGWDWQNPPVVEQAFRRGYLIGARRFVESRGFGFVQDEPGDMELAANLNDAIHRRRGELYAGDRWTDRRTALLRGCQHGLLDAVRARAAGVSITKLVAWLDDLHTWASEDPIRLEWKYARPPDAPDPDGPPLGRDGTPRKLWSEVFGLWTMVDALSAPVTLVRQRGPFIESKDQFEKLRAAELAKLRERIRAHKGEFTGLETLGQYEPDVQAVWREELEARSAAPASPLGNIERLLHPDPAVRRAATSAPATSTTQAQAVVSREPTPVMVRLSDVQPEPVRWLWPGRIALGKLTLLCGDPGLGKSFVTLDLAARVSAGSPWPDLPLLPNAKGNVILLSAEDDIADTIRPRLDVAEADVSRVVAIQAVRRLLVTGQTQEDYFDLTEDLPVLEAAIRAQPDCRLVVIDPLTAYLGKTDSHKNAEVRAVLAKLFELAARHKVAVLAVTHLNKASTLPAIYRAMGSLAFVAAARAVWAVVRDDHDDTGRRRLFVPIKNNLGADETGLAYALEPVGDTARVAWESEPVNMRADDALGGGRGTPGPQAEARTEVEAWLRQALADGPRPAKDMLEEARHAHGFSSKTVERARKNIGLEAYRETVPGPWFWRLPQERQVDPSNKEPGDLGDLDVLEERQDRQDGQDRQDVRDRG